MREVVLYIFSFFIIYLFTFGNTYCDGWEEGYKEGYCYEIVNCIEPVIPVCPTPEIGFDTYQDGYNRGFKKGQEKQEE